MLTEDIYLPVGVPKMVLLKGYNFPPLRVKIFFFFFFNSLMFFSFLMCVCVCLCVCVNSLVLTYSKELYFFVLRYLLFSNVQANLPSYRCVVNTGSAVYQASAELLDDRHITCSMPEVSHPPIVSGLLHASA